ncbi:hypothetical protein ACM66B_002538 [Microbotryomycetes sp. NB124-2]
MDMAADNMSEDVDEPSSPDSLFDEVQVPPEVLIATRHPPPVPGLFLYRDAVPLDLQHSLAVEMSRNVWPDNSDQVMLFESPCCNNLPAFLTPLLDNVLPAALKGLPQETYDNIFNSKLPRQVIMNLYKPGQGISRHVDLPSRYGDGIVGVSLCGSTVMEFERDSTVHALLLRPGDVYVLSGEARWDWKHGIAHRLQDLVSDGDDAYELYRRTRMSITLRRMKNGADLVGS